jgi:hypothetical protein|tara:strand:- start:1026 stop:1310 length:285 start_codon:yes stop_codon:yes gene_type:complete
MKLASCEEINPLAELAHFTALCYAPPQIKYLKNRLHTTKEQLVCQVLFKEKLFNQLRISSCSNPLPDQNQNHFASLKHKKSQMMVGVLLVLYRI